MTLKYTFLILSIVVLFFIFYKQYDFGERWTSRDLFNNTSSLKEYMVGLGGCVEPQTETDGPVEEPSCGNVNDYRDSTNLPLKEYCVKSCFNSAYDGTDVSINTLLERIQNGYRFIDLNVFCADDDNLYVGFSPDNTPKLVSNKLLLSDALKTINDAAFSSSTAFNTNLSNVSSYPVFIHIRVYRKPDSKVNVIEKVANVINGQDDKPPAYTSNYLRSLDTNSNSTPTQIDGCTVLSSIMGKVVFSMDILNILEIYSPIQYQSATQLDPQAVESLQKFVNILSGGSTFPAFYRYTDESIVHRTNKLGVGNATINGSLKTNVKHMYISFPHPDDVSKRSIPSTTNATDVVQPNIKTFVLDRSIQFAPLRVYLADKELDNYIKMFDTIGKPFVPMTHVYQYLNTN